MSSTSGFDDGSGWAARREATPWLHDDRRNRCVPDGSGGRGGGFFDRAGWSAAGRKSAPIAVVSWNLVPPLSKAFRPRPPLIQGSGRERWWETYYTTFQLAFLRRTRSHDRRPPSMAASRRSCGFTVWRKPDGAKQFGASGNYCNYIKRIGRSACSAPCVQNKGKAETEKERKRKNIPDDEADRCGAGKGG